MWVRKGIEITRRLNAGVLMMVFFGKCQVLQRAELNRVIGLFRELTPEAKRAGVTLGFENTSSGEDNRYAIDQVQSDAFKMWYDVGNSTFNGYDVPKEIRALGRDRICMFHFKDRAYLGEGLQHRGRGVAVAHGDHLRPVDGAPRARAADTVRDRRARDRRHQPARTAARPRRAR